MVWIVIVVMVVVWLVGLLDNFGGSLVYFFLGLALLLLLITMVGGRENR